MAFLPNENYKKSFRWTIKQQLQFLRQLVMLLQAGLALKEAVSFCVQVMPPRYALFVKGIYAQLEDGEPLSICLWRAQFHRQVIFDLHFAEQQGRLEELLSRTIDWLEAEERQRETLQKVLLYPLTMMVLLLILIGCFTFIIFPQFASLFQSLQLEVPMTLQIVGSLRQLYVPTLCFIGAVGVIGYIKRHELTLHARPMARLFYRNRVLRPIAQLYFSHFIASQLSYLLNSGRSVHEALRSFAELHVQSFTVVIVEQLMERLATGETFSNAVRQTPYLLNSLANLLHSCEASGDLARHLYSYSDYTKRQWRDGVNRLIKAVQPCLFFVIASVVIALYGAMIMPLFSMMDQL